MKRLILSILLTVAALPASAMDFESIDCQKYFAALAQGDPRLTLFHERIKTGMPLDTAATEQFNEGKLKWAGRRAELVADDVTELTQIITEAIPVYRKHVKELERDIRAAERKFPDNPDAGDYWKEQLDDNFPWRNAVDITIGVPYGYKNREHFLKYNTGFDLPSPAIAQFYGGKIGQQLKALAAYHQAFHEVLFKEHPYSAWDNIKDELLLGVQEKAITKYNRGRSKYKFDEKALLTKRAGSPDREHAKEILKLAKTLSEDETVPAAHQAMLKDHLAYLERYRMDPGSLFIDYVETLRTRPKNQPEKKD